MTVPSAAAAEALIRSAARGDETAFARLIAEHNAAMARVAYVIVGDREMTLDAVQAAWAIAWRKLGTLRDPGQVGPWLVAIAANEAQQQRRRQRRATVVDISYAIDRVGTEDPAVHGAFEVDDCRVRTDWTLTIGDSWFFGSLLVSTQGARYSSGSGRKAPTASATAANNGVS